MSNISFRTAQAVVIGTGAAGYNAACRLKQLGTDVLLITEDILCGTSRNTGSDKQTYYKLGLSGDTPDSVRAMAQNLFSCGAVDGDNALCEAALSARCFLNLCELGVAFPVNRYGEYIGYKTDHDPFARATSAGPLTSRFMTEALEKRARQLNVEVLDQHLAVEILKQDGKVCGIVCLNKQNDTLEAIRTGNVILATGGPAGIFADSVYPHGHTGTTSLALCAGAGVQNMTEWQFGLASVRPRWNVSGTYMQVLPRFVSVDPDGIEREFLADYFADPYEALSMVFLKGYQWPFDSRKVLVGSSVIDLLVYRECVHYGRKVYLDYRTNPFGLRHIDFSRLLPEAREYLEKAQAAFGTPIERLQKMNTPAIELYQSKGVDIHKEMLQIALCAQHNNGGISVDAWWQTCLPGLFAAGECAGTHGITRPGGSALNAGQVGSLRAALYISEKGQSLPDENVFLAAAGQALARHAAFCENALHNPDNARNAIAEAQRRMSDHGAAIRKTDAMVRLKNEVADKLHHFDTLFGAAKPEHAYKLRDLLITQLAVLTAQIDFAEKLGFTRGSALYYDPDGTLRQGLDECFRFVPDTMEKRDTVQQVFFDGSDCTASWRTVRPLPNNDDFFENVWRSYRENKNIY